MKSMGKGDMPRRYRLVIEKILSGEIKNVGQLDYEKRRLAKELNLGRFIRNSEILRFAKPSEKEKLKLLVKKPIRTESGVAVVAVIPAFALGRDVAVSVVRPVLQDFNDFILAVVEPE